MKGLSKYLIIANEIKDKELEWSEKARSIILSKGAEARISVINSMKGTDEEFEGAEAVIVMGGDGTMLRVAQLISGREIPVIGVNLGTVGFLTEAVSSELESMIDRLIEGQYAVEGRMMLSGTVHTSNGEKNFDALNDIVMARINALRIIAVKINVNGKYFDTTEADGIIISTPTGSTGYNLSAGGPIVQPDARLMVLTPISPYSLSRHSIVFGADDIITLELMEKRKDAENLGIVAFDGAESVDIEVGDKVDIRVSGNVFHLIRLDDSSVYEILRKKIGG